MVSAIVLTVGATLIDAQPLPRDDTQNIQLVRAYYSGINTYLRTGSAAALEPTHQPLTESTPFSAARSLEELESLIELAALRQSYPGLHFRLDTLNATDDAVIAGVSTHAGEDALPGWLTCQPNHTETLAPVLFQPRDGNALIHSGDEIFAPAFLNLVAPDTTFLLSTPSRLTIAELLLAGPATGMRFVPLPGPGVFIVQSGSLLVSGNSLAEVVELRTAHRSVVSVGSERVANQGDAIVVPLGRAVVGVAANSEVKIIATVAVPVESDPDRYFEREKGEHAQLEFGMLDVLRDFPDGRQSLWFGSVLRLSGESVPVDAGSVALNVGWLLVPSGGMVTVARQQGGLALYAPPGEGQVTLEPSWAATRIANSGSTTSMLLLARVVPFDTRE
jgi:hypothetical protein